jgi:hypothetical protein
MLLRRGGVGVARDDSRHVLAVGAVLELVIADAAIWEMRTETTGQPEKPAGDAPVRNR